MKIRKRELKEGGRLPVCYVCRSSSRNKVSLLRMLVHYCVFLHFDLEFRFPGDLEKRLY